MHCFVGGSKVGTTVISQIESVAGNVTVALEMFPEKYSCCDGAELVVVSVPLFTVVRFEEFAVDIVGGRTVTSQLDVVFGNAAVSVMAGNGLGVTEELPGAGVPAVAFVAGIAVEFDGGGEVVVFPLVEFDEGAAVEFMSGLAGDGTVAGEDNSALNADEMIVAFDAADIGLCVAEADAFEHL